MLRAAEPAGCLNAVRRCLARGNEQRPNWIDIRTTAVSSFSPRQQDSKDSLARTCGRSLLAGLAGEGSPGFRALYQLDERAPRHHSLLNCLPGRHKINNSFKII